ncbi:MAG: class I SAM-dependent methyltransferase [Asticcacaulis sp.]|uniref:class I SAM-dependent methyltransferase n=1 Tax=Asticcacaulis sp. TaxID=1872648 RepID=UPI0039E36BF5
MSETEKLFGGSIPENYDRHMVPLIFAPYAADLARRVTALSPRAVLETAAGSGAVTRALAPELPGVRYVATDLNQGMVDYAATHQPSDAPVEWRQADALALPFADASFDVVCCQFGAMFFPDRIAGYREARRVLKPGGTFLFSVWDRIEENVFANEVILALAERFPENPPRFLVRGPHSYFDTAAIRSDLATAGFSDIAIDTHSEQSRAASARIVATAFCQGSPLRTEIEANDPSGLEAATRHVTDYLVARHGHGPVTAKIQAHIISAKA